VGRRGLSRSTACAAAWGLVACSACGETPEPPAHAQPAATQHRVRVAVFNTSLSQNVPGALLASLVAGGDARGRDVATILQVVRPDVVLLLEVDRDPAVTAALLDGYVKADVGVPKGPLDYPYVYAPPTNTGVPSGLDLDRDGSLGGPGDALGFGRFPGHYGMLVLSRYPLAGPVQCAGTRLWRDIPGARLPDDPATDAPGDWYDDAALQRLPLSSKNHCDVVLSTPGGPLHLLVSHPTPPVFDGPEDRNGLRNAAELDLWRAYLDGAPLASEPAGPPQPLPAAARFVLAGDLNADPADGETAGAIAALLTHPRLHADVAPTSVGGVAASRRDGGVNGKHKGDPAHDTADFSEGARGPGNLRADYVLPSANLSVAGAGVFWPQPGEPYAQAVESSDHRLVWVDVDLANQ